MSFADRVEQDLDRWEAELRQEHEAGDHAEPDPDCGRCRRTQREALNVEGDPAFNGAFSRW